MLTQLGTSGSIPYAGQFMKARVEKIIDAVENGETPTSAGFAMAIPGSDAAKSGQYQVFEKNEKSGSIAQLHKFDTNNDGLISIREGGTMLMETAHSIESDGEQNGFLTRDFNSPEDLAELLGTKFDGIFSKAEVEAMHAKFDKDRDGKLSSEESKAAYEEIEAEAKKRIEAKIEKTKNNVISSSQVEASSNHNELKSNLRYLKRN